MLLKPPPEPNRVVATSASIAAFAPGGRVVLPTLVMKGHELGYVGEKTVFFGPKHPSLEPSREAGPTTPSSPDATRIEVPEYS